MSIKLDHINIFVLSYERPSITVKCIQSFQKYITINKTIFICDNNSSDETKQILKDNLIADNVRFYWNTENKWVRGFNTAVNENLQDFFIISDNDIFLREYDIDIVNHMFSLLQKYELSTIGLNCYQANNIHGATPTKKEPDIIVTKMLDTTFQLMRRNAYDDQQGVNFTKDHMQRRKRKAAWTCAPYFCDHLDPTIERHMIQSGDLEYIEYSKKKVVNLEKESPTKYDFIRNSLMNCGYGIQET